MKTNYNNIEYVKYIVTIKDATDSICFMSDSMETSIIINPNDSFDADFIFNDGWFDREFGQHFFKHKTFLADTYELKIKLYDSSFNIFDSASKSIEIKNQKYPALKFPLDNYQIYDSLLNYIRFQWTAAENTESTDHYYHFAIFEINDSSHIYSLDSCFNSGSYVYENTLLNDTFIIIPYLESILDTNKLYGWSVKTYLEPNHSNPIVANKGLTPPYILKPSRSKRDFDGCTNKYMDGFETGTLNGWVCYIGRRNGPIIDIGYSKMPGPVLTRHEIQTVGSNDPIGGFPVVPEGGGIYSLKLGGDINAGYQAHKVSKTFYVDQPNQHITLRYAAVLEYGNHAETEEAFLVVSISGKRIFNRRMNFLDFPIVLFAGANDGITQTSGDISFRNWDCIKLDLSKYYRSNVTIEISSGSCSFGAHFGYAYIDFCGIVDPTPSLITSNSYCTNSVTNVNGSGSSNYLTWKYSVCTTNSLLTNFGPKYFSPTYNNNIPTNYDIYSLIKQTGVECGYFKVTLHLKKSCTEWFEDYDIIFVNCPANGLAGPDKCCTNGFCTNLVIGQAPIAGNSYLWVGNTNCLNNTTTSQPTFNTNLCNPAEFFPHMKVLQVTTGTCSSYDTVWIYSSNPIYNSVTLDSTSTLCDMFLTVNGSNFNKVQWQWTIPGTSTTKTVFGTKITFPRYTSNVQVTVTLINPCGNVANTITVPKRRGFNNFNNLVLIFPNALNTNSPISKNRKLLIFEFGLSEGASNAYMGAHSAKIDFMNSHGEINLGKNWYSPTGFNNGDIYWDGKLSGQNIPQGVYHWMITLENCEFEAESFKYRAAAWQQVNYKRYFFGLIQTQQYRIIEWTADAEMWHEVTVLH